MKKPYFTRKFSNYLMLTIALFTTQACSRSYHYKEIAVPEPVKLSKRLEAIFAKTKLVCFGRYAIEVPHEAQLVWGSIWIPSPVEIRAGRKRAIDW